MSYIYISFVCFSLVKPACGKELHVQKKQVRADWFYVRPLLETPDLRNKPKLKSVECERLQERSVWTGSTTHLVCLNEAEVSTS